MLLLTLAFVVIKSGLAKYCFGTGCCNTGESCDTSGVQTEGECQNYCKGGTTGFHFYTCCNNLDESSDEVCNWRTWQGVTKEYKNGKYCGYGGSNEPVGIPNVHIGCKNYNFGSSSYGCGGCSGQLATQRKCDKWNEVPLTCWWFQSCFSEQCKVYQSFASSALYESSENENLCGNGLCDNDESVESCPMDCCQTVNQQCNYTAAHQNLTYDFGNISFFNMSNATNATNASCVVPICCSTSSCCGSSSADTKNGASKVTSSTQLMTGIATIILAAMMST